MTSAIAIANGELAAPKYAIARPGDDRSEIGVLSAVFRHMLSYLQSMAALATAISKGDLQQQIAPKSEKDILGNAFQQMTRYLNQMGHLAEQISQGNLRNSIALRSEHDQIGAAFSRMQEGLVSLIANIRAESEDIGSISGHMQDVSTGNATALEQIGQAAVATSTAMQQMTRGTEDIRIKTEQLNAAIEAIQQMAHSIRQVAENSKELSTIAESTTATVVSIIDSLERIADRAEHSKDLSETTTENAVSGSEAVKDVTLSIQSISEITTHISELIFRLQEHSGSIGSILDVINDVADQTSLLSLNASIIAAQAGEHGRGFAVVANEIRELAHRVGASTKKIAKIVSLVQHDSLQAATVITRGQAKVEEGVAVAQKAGGALEQIEQSARNSSALTAEIAALIRQQTTSSTTLTNALQEVSDLITAMTLQIQEQEHYSLELFEIVENIRQVSAEVIKTTQGQQQKSAKIAIAMDSVLSLVLENSETVQLMTESSHELSRKAKLLKHQVEQFVIPEQTPQEPH